MPPSVTPSAITIGGRIVGTFFFGVFLAAGLFFEVIMVRQVAKDIALQNWTQVEATVVTSEIIPPRDSEKNPALHVRYTYLFRGQNFTSERFGPSSRDFENSSAYQEAEHFTTGARVPCWVNPSSPSEAVLRRSHPAAMLIALFPLIFVAVGGIGIWAMWRTGNRTALENASISSRANPVARGRVALILFCSVFLVAGLVVAYAIVVRPVLKIFAAQNWTEVPCEILSSRVQRHSGEHSDTYSVDIVYRYTSQGRTFTSNSYQFVSGSSSGYEGKAEIVRQFPSGRRTVCYVNPENPGDAVIERRFTSDLWFGVIPFAFVLFGGGGLVYALKRKPEGAAAPSPFHQPRQDRGVSHSASNATWTALPPATSRKSKFFVLLFAAVFWNGIVSVFVVSLFAGKWTAVNWFPALFLIPFVLVGLGLIAGVFYQAMALFNPKPRVIASRDSAVPGETVEIRWELAGRTQALRQLRLSFEGREEATYRRGTDTKTDKATFKTVVLVETSDPSAIGSGSVKLTVPPGTMHSFRTTNNKVIWVFHLKGSIPRWPDLDEEFTFTVLPYPLAS